MNNWIKNGAGVAAVAAVTVGTGWAVQHYHRPGQLDVLTAQAMDMSQMRPPTGSAPVALAAVRRGSLADTVTYTGTVAAYNEQALSPRITGTLVFLPVYPGDSVKAGQIVAKLDTSEVGPQAAEAAADARQAQIGAQIASLTHRLHHQAALDQAQAMLEAAEQGVPDARAEADAARQAIADTEAGVTSAQATADYWNTEIVRERQLADAGAVSRQEYQNELSQAQAAHAAVSQAQAKVRQASATAQAARDRIAVAQRQASAARAGVRMAQADMLVAEGQTAQARAGADAAKAAAGAAAAQAGYSQIAAPFAGLVTARPVAPGTLVQPGTTVLKIAEINCVRVQANVAASDLTGIHIGSPVQITVQGDSGRTFAAHITSVFPSANAETRTAIVEAVVPNPGARLLPGAFVTMQITTETVKDRLLVPSSAVISQGGGSAVWTASNGTAHRVSVQAGATNGALTAVASDALTAGTPVVTRGQAGLTDGSSVVATAWGLNGPQTLPAATSGQTVYRCEKCGMTYSAADAKKNNFVDPMDGGKLVPVAPAPKNGGMMPGMKM
jgi:RND family efflux transporter MFP subunit